MKTSIVFSIVLVLFSVQAAVAQEKLSPNQTVAKKIEPGKNELFSIDLNDGDFVNVSIGYKGRINFFLLNPDGTIAARLIGSSGEAKVPFVFAAEGAGAYSFKIESPGDQSATYDLAIGEVIALNERLKPQ